MTSVLLLARRALWLALVLACVCSTRNASAADDQLEWHAPPECPDRAAIVSRVNRLLGKPMQSSLRAITDVTRTIHGYRAQLRTVSATRSGERVLEHPRCDMLADSVAVVIALTVATPSDTQNDSTEHFHIAGDALVGTVFGTLPKPAFGVGAALALELSGLRLELRGVFQLPQSDTFAGMQLGATFSVVSFAARACWLTSIRALALDVGPCIGVDVSRVRAIGFGGEDEVVTLSGRATAWSPALGAFGRLRLATAFGIVLTAEVAMPTSRDRFVFADVGTLHRASLVTAQLLIAPEVRF